jgi:uncharacterized protein (DUF58 family)
VSITLARRHSTDPAGGSERARLDRLGPWQRTPAASRALLLGAAGAVLGVLTRRVDLLVLAVPFVLVATWGWLARPRGTGSAEARVGNRTLAEGDATAWTVTLQLPPGAEETILRLSPGRFVTVGPDADRTAVCAPADGGPVTRRIVARTTRWGMRRIGPGLIGARSAWWAYRTPICELGAFWVTATPAAARFDAAAMAPHPEGLVGVNRSVRPGAGTEFATIRPFQPGDRLRRIHWPSTLRSGTVQARTMYADADAHVVLVVDALSDLGPREGIDGRATSLDLTVRACAALAEHYARSGDRISLRVLGSESVSRVPVGSGRAQIRRVLDTLARIQPATDRDAVHVRALAGLGSGSLVVVLSPLVHPDIVGLVAAAAASGLTTIVIDTLPGHLVADPDDAYAALAWRLRRLDRDEEVHRLRAAGVPVVTWVGPGSLDVVLRGLARRTHARLVRR